MSSPSISITADQPPVGAVTASAVPEHRRLTILPTYLGPHMARGEALVYAHMSAMCGDYHGGFWDFFELSNGGFYMAPASPQRYALRVDGNGFDGSVGADAAGLIACLFAFNQLAWARDGERYSDLFYRVRAYALEHAEAPAILRAID